MRHLIIALEKRGHFVAAEVFRVKGKGSEKKFDPKKKEKVLPSELLKALKPAWVKKLQQKYSADQLEKKAMEFLEKKFPWAKEYAIPV